MIYRAISVYVYVTTPPQAFPPRAPPSPWVPASWARALKRPLREDAAEREGGVF